MKENFIEELEQFEKMNKAELIDAFLPFTLLVGRISLHYVQNFDFIDEINSIRRKNTAISEQASEIKARLLSLNS